MPRILDFGSGPGTASLAFLASALEAHPRGKAVEATLVWIDSDRAILEDGKAFLDLWKEREPRLANVRLETRVGAWWKETAPLARSGEAALAFFGHVLNETGGDPERAASSLAPVVHRKGAGAGTIFLEPAAPDSARHLSRLRDLLLDSFPEKTGKPARPWGPCLHADACPLSQGRDWCHFSYPAKVPGEWHAHFTRALAPGRREREWLKFSYAWLPSPESLPAAENPNRRLVVSDRIPPNDFLVCEPERPRKIRPRVGLELGRGSLVDLNEVSGSTPKTAHPRAVPRSGKGR